MRGATDPRPAQGLEACAWPFLLALCPLAAGLMACGSVGASPAAYSWLGAGSRVPEGGEEGTGASARLAHARGEHLAVAAQAS